MTTRTSALLLSALLFAGLVACGGDDPARPGGDDNTSPVARLQVTPPSVPLNDDHATVLTLDGRQSSDPDGDELTFLWSVPGARFVEDTDATTPRARITLPGDEPVTVSLTVTDGRGGESTADFRVELEDENGGGGEPSVVFAEVVSGLDQPVHLDAPPGDDRLFVVEKTGRIRIVRDGAPESEPFLDLSGQVSGGGEQGLLSVAFHPEYASNGRFFVNYTDTGGRTVVERYSVSGDPDVADPASATRILRIDQPFSNHNGGLLRFGLDGMLYVGMGDGGSAGDPGDRAQDLSTLLGKLLRLDPDGGEPYAIPADNPFVGQEGARDEIWAYGLRNPWRFSFDPPSGTLYVADVGQNAWEEVNAVPAGEAGVDYGWRRVEGRSCFESGCSFEGTTLPALVYSHAEGCSVTGGHAYRGSLVPELRGHYFYADLCGGWIRSFRLEGGEAGERTERATGVGSVTSFGTGGDGELYVVTIEGSVFRMEAG